MITINQEKCKRDRICAIECPSGLIDFVDKDAYPSPAAGAGEQCLSCGHCVSVCPYGAIAIDGITPEDCQPLNQDLMPSANQVEFLLKSRRSIRRFKKQAVDRELLNQVIEVARFAPSGHNTQSVHWLVIEDKNEVQVLAGLTADWMRAMITSYPQVAASMHMEEVVAAWEQGADRICRNAPHVMLAYGPKAVGATPASCTIALTYLELAAYSLGLGTCWAGYLGAAAASFPPLQERLDLPKGYKVYGAMMVGYPQYRYQRIPPRLPARITWR